MPGVARAWLRDLDELEALCKELERLGWLSSGSQLNPPATNASKLAPFEPVYWFKLTHAGWQRALELQRTRGTGNQAFVAMWFNDSVRDAFDMAIVPALQDTGYKPYRVDREHSSEKIDNRIWPRSGGVTCSLRIALVIDPVCILRLDSRSG